MKVLTYENGYKSGVKELCTWSIPREGEDEPTQEMRQNRARTAVEAFRERGLPTDWDKGYAAAFSDYAEGVNL